MKFLNNDLKVWNEQEFSDVEGQKKLYWRNSREWRRGKEEVNTEAERAHKIQVTEDIERVSVLKKNISWRQKLQTFWLKE